MSISKIQAELKAPKGQTNAFGKYKYRSCEDIVEAVKPLLAEYGYHLNITDEIQQIGDRFYVKATASVREGEKIISEASAFAREPLSRKGMDEAQITGATSSYARKYAMNGLFAIDDTKDADTTDNREIQQMNPEPINQERVDACYEMYKQEVDADEEGRPDCARMQTGNSRLTNDERMAVIDKFGKEKPEGATRMYKTIISDCLKWHPADDEVAE